MSRGSPPRNAQTAGDLGFAVQLIFMVSDTNSSKSLCIDLYMYGLDRYIKYMEGKGVISTWSA